jgi:hypothetical protein
LSVPERRKSPEQIEAERFCVLTPAIWYPVSKRRPMGLTQKGRSWREAKRTEAYIRNLGEPEWEVFS